MNVNHKTRLIIAFLQCGCLLCLFFSGCDLRRIGPPIPELFAREYMTAHGYSSDDIRRLMEYDKIDHVFFLRLSREPDESVRHLLARNSHLTKDERAFFLGDKDDYVVGGLAMNPSLSRDEIIALSKSHSRSVLYGLAMNPFVPEEILIEIYNKKSAPKSAFAVNPNCPASIGKEIQKFGSSSEKELFATWQGEKSKNIYLGKVIRADNK